MVSNSGVFRAFRTRLLILASSVSTSSRPTKLANLVLNHVTRCRVFGFFRAILIPPEFGSRKFASRPHDRLHRSSDKVVFVYVVPSFVTVGTRDVGAAYV